MMTPRTPSPIRTAAQTRRLSSLLVLALSTAAYAEDAPETPRTETVTEPDATSTEPANTGVRSPDPNDPCTYAMSNWHVASGRAVNRQTIRTTRGALAADEVDPDDPRCSVCEEDQVRIDPATLGLAGVSSFQVCIHYRDVIEEALRVIAADGSFEIRELTGYRPGRTRGRVVDGVRTELSNHSYGTAIDINARFNGLYRRCNVAEVSAETIQRCQLGVGGAWDPLRNPRLTIQRGGIVWREFTQRVGWRWGGEISGATKDMMHFSLTGY